MNHCLLCNTPLHAANWHLDGSVCNACYLNDNPQPHKKRKKIALTVALNPGEKEKLERIAAESGYLWGEKPNISDLVSAVANRQYLHGQIEAGTLSIQCTRMAQELEIAHQQLADISEILGRSRLAQIVPSQVAMPSDPQSTPPEDEGYQRIRTDEQKRLQTMQIIFGDDPDAP